MSEDSWNAQMLLVWKMHMTFIFKSRDLWLIVNGTSQKSAAADPDAWEKSDKTAAVAILNAITKKHKEEVMSCSTSAEMWTQLLAFHEKTSEDCIIGLQEQF